MLTNNMDGSHRFTQPGSCHLSKASLTSGQGKPSEVTDIRKPSRLKTCFLLSLGRLLCDSRLSGLLPLEDRYITQDVSSAVAPVVLTCTIDFAPASLFIPLGGRECRLLSPAAEPSQEMDRNGGKEFCERLDSEKETRICWRYEFDSTECYSSESFFDKIILISRREELWESACQGHSWISHFG